MIADELRRQADHFIELQSLRGEVGREPGERAAPRRAEPESDDDEGES
jgi:uncharacterized LabA/DUF88 family protein